MVGEGATKRQVDRTSRRIVWVLALMMLLSFGFGVFMFIPEEHRAQKLDEMMYKYKARQLRVSGGAESD